MEIVIRAERLWDYLLGQRGGDSTTTGKISYSSGTARLNDRGREILQGLRDSTNRKAERGRLKIES